MNFNELVSRTQSYARSKTSGTFTETVIGGFLNEGIDQLHSYKPFRDMPYIVKGGADPVILPSAYHFLLAMYAGSRCMDIDERKYEGVQLRNEFEYKFAELQSLVDCGDLKIYDGNGIEILERSTVTDYIVDEYYGTSTDEESVI